MEIGEMACSSPAWCSHGLALNNFHVCLYGYVKSMSLEASCYVFPYSFSLWSRCVFENGESVVSIQTDVIFTVLVAKVVKDEEAILTHSPFGLEE